MRERISQAAHRVSAHAVGNDPNVAGTRFVARTVRVGTGDDAGYDRFDAGVGKSRVGADHHDDVGIRDRIRVSRQVLLVEFVGDVHRDGPALRVAIENDGARFTAINPCPLGVSDPVGGTDVDRIVVGAVAGEIELLIADNDPEGRRVLHDRDFRIVGARAMRCVVEPDVDRAAVLVASHRGACAADRRRADRCEVAGAGDEEHRRVFSETLREPAGFVPDRRRLVPGPGQLNRGEPDGTLRALRSRTGGAGGQQ